MIPEIRGPFDRTDTPTINNEPSRTKQSFAEEANVNTIMARWHRTGVIEHLSKATPRYGDFATADDYQSACNKVLGAEHAFMELPAEIRARMGNNPGNLLLFLADPANLEEAQKLGLVEKSKPEAEPSPAPKKAKTDPDPAPPDGSLNLKTPGGDPPPTGTSPIQGGD